MRFLILAGLWVYRRFLTRFTPACPDPVSCSEFAVRAVREHGVQVGLGMAVAKIEGCGKS